MQATFSELITEQNWGLFSTRLGLDHIGLEIHSTEYGLWNIPDDFKGNISLIGRGTRVQLLSINSKIPDEKVARLISACSRKTEDILLWVVLTSKTKLAVFDRITRKVQSVGIGDLDSKDLNLEKHTGTSMASLFDVSEMTDRFFRDFRNQHQLLTNALQNGPEDHETRKRIALIWLLRITFLYFAQSQGALNGDLNYLAKSLNKFTKKNEHQFQQKFLNVIFFDLLNTPVSKRRAAAKKLGEIPFLNGGLFEPSSDESAWEDMAVHNSVWKVVFTTLFEKYRFVSEGEALPDANAIDPEMLGKVFEALMSAGDRKRTGAFYTPRKIIRKMVEEGIYGCLGDDLNLAPEIFRGELRGHAKRKEIISKLNTLRVLDPAAGTGGFLVDSLHVIQDLRRRLGLPFEGKEVQETIHRHLFGVDKNPIAIRLCELRFWLQILSAYRGPIADLPPLPNLSHRFVSGDALLDPFETFSSGIIRSKWKSIARLQNDFSRSHGSEKRALRHTIDNEKRSLQMAEIRQRQCRQIEERTLIENALDGEDLLGEPIKATRFQAEVLRKNRQEGEALFSLEDRVQRSAEAPVFSFHSHFPDVMRRGGFDLILMNPPWVRHHHIPGHERAILQKRYKSNATQLWDDASLQNVRSRYGSQSDLSSMFLEKASELCRPRGRVVALVPSKIMRGISSAPIRGMLGKLDIQSLTDLSESKERLFDATTYPAILSFRNQNPNGSLRTSSTGTKGELKRQNELMMFGNDSRAPWTCANANLVNVIRRICSDHRPLGSFTNLQPRRGIYTGANELFVKSVGEFPESFSPFLRPLVEGKGRTRELLYLYDDKAAVLKSVPNEIEAYFEKHRSSLEARADYKNTKPLWQIFRNHPDLFGTKIIWRDISKWFEPTLDHSAAIPLNTVYLIPCKDLALGERLLKYFESDFVQTFIRLLAERVRGGHRRHFAWAIQCIPIPDSVLTGKKECGLKLSKKERAYFREFIEHEKL